MSRIPAHVRDRILPRESPIRAWRELLNLSLSTVAKRTRIELARLIELEAERGLPTPMELEALSATLGIPREHLTTS